MLFHGLLHKLLVNVLNILVVAWAEGALNKDLLLFI